MTNVLESLRRKLNPAHFPGMSGRMAAIVGYVLDERYTVDEIVELIVLGDGPMLARVRHHTPDGERVTHTDAGFDEFIGDQYDFLKNWHALIKAARLTAEEEKELVERLRRKIMKGY